jgi:hypothetical protein
VIHGYSETIDFNGGIYGSRNTFGLDSNTIILFAFVLVMVSCFDARKMSGALLTQHPGIDTQLCVHVVRAGVYQAVHL